MFEAKEDKVNARALTAKHSSNASHATSAAESVLREKAVEQRR